MKLETLFTHFENSIDSESLNSVKQRLNKLTPPEIALQIESTPSKFRKILWSLVDSKLSGLALHDLSDEIQNEILEDMDASSVALLTEGLDIDDVVDILQHIPEKMIPAVLDRMSGQDRYRIEKVLTYPENTAGGLMDPNVITVRPDITVKLVLRYLRRFDNIPNNFDNIFVVDRSDKFIGILPINTLLTSSATKMVYQLMEDNCQIIDVNASDSEVAETFKLFNLVTAPVVDNDSYLLGQIMIDDVVDVIIDEADHSLFAMAGLQDSEDTFLSVKKTAPKRSLWLGLNLITAIIASSAIGIFQDAIEELVALAVLMPIVASMVGVAGSQTLTVVVRGMALGQIEKQNVRWLFSKEFAVGILNGLCFSLVTGILVSIWFENFMLAVIVGLAMIINLTAAALSGTLVPIILKRIRVDPAVAGSVILTTITDVVGFVSFLGLSALLLI